MVVAQREAGLVVGFDGDAVTLVGVAPVVEEDEERRVQRERGKKRRVFRRA